MPALPAVWITCSTPMRAVAGTQAQRTAQAQVVQQAQQVATLAQSRYRAGAETLLTLLDAQRTLYAAQDMAAQLHQAEWQAQVALYRALGGGWQPDVDAGVHRVATTVRP
jgi:outer membrane protein TolC